MQKCKSKNENEGRDDVSRDEWVGWEGWEGQVG